MSKLQSVLDTYRSTAEEVPARGRDFARTAVDQIRHRALDLRDRAQERALDLRDRAQGRARTEIDHRRSTAATTLANLADEIGRASCRERV